MGSSRPFGLAVSCSAPSLVSDQGRGLRSAVSAAAWLTCRGPLQRIHDEASPALPILVALEGFFSR
jgi:hypothetical protein